jgi:hypothetical protein
MRLPMNSAKSDSVESVAVKGIEPVTEWVSHSTAESDLGASSFTGITPEIVAVIEAAATAYVGTRIRILSIKVLSEWEQDSSAWAGRGRDIVHASHNLVQRGH